MLRQVQPPIPQPFRALVRWLRDRRGIDLISRFRVNDIWIGDVRITPTIARSLVSLVGEEETPREKNPRNKHPAKSRDAPSDDF